MTTPRAPGPRLLRSLPWTGAALGAAAGLAAWRAAESGDASGYAFDALFLASLPWSLALWAAGALWAAVTGGDSAPSALVYAMPAAAGWGWGWLAAAVARAIGRARGRPGRPSAAR
jgi:hypothetical protein